MSNTKIKVGFKLLRKLNYYFKSQYWLVEDDFSLWSKGFIFNLKYKNIPIVIGICVFLVKGKIYNIEYSFAHRKTRRYCEFRLTNHFFNRLDLAVKNKILIQY